MKYFVFLIFSVFLVACEGPPPETPPSIIANGLAGKTYYRKVDNYYYNGGVAYGFAEYIYHRPDGIATEWQQNFGRSDELSKLPWTVRQGQVCYGAGNSPYCRNVYFENGKLRFSSGQIRSGDIGRTQRRNGLRPHNASNLTLAQSLEKSFSALNEVVQTAVSIPAVQGLASGITTLCGGGACEFDHEQAAREEAINAAAKSAAANAKQCKAAVRQCTQSCGNLSGVGDSSFLGIANVGSSPKSRCVAECQKTNCG